MRHAPLPCLLTGLILLALASHDPAVVHTQAQPRPQMSVKPSADFEVTGTGSHPGWAEAPWVSLRKRQPDGHPYETRFRMLYSNTGLYFHMEATDAKLTATMTEDFLDLWNEDVFEVFLWTDERYPVYFEYQISPLNYELAILVPNFGGQFLGWRPWHYEGDRLTRKATSTTGGPKTPHAAITGWSAEFFIPYALLRPLQNVPPKPGPDGAPTSTAWIMTTGGGRSGSGRRWANRFTSTSGSAISCSRAAETTHHPPPTRCRLPTAGTETAFGSSPRPGGCRIRRSRMPPRGAPRSLCRLRTT